MRLIVLAAGDSSSFDGFNKLFLVHPIYKRPMIEMYKTLFKTEDICIVVGYRALEVMSKYPDFQYAYNSKWKETGNSYSLALALNNTPSVVISSDLFISQKAVDALLSTESNSVLIKNQENKRSKGLACNIQNGKIEYIVPIKKGVEGPELCGVFKIIDYNLLQKWKKNCFNNPSLFAGKNLPLESFVESVLTNDNELYEVDTPEEYIIRLKS